MWSLRLWHRVVRLDVTGISGKLLLSSTRALLTLSWKAVFIASSWQVFSTCWFAASCCYVCCITLNFRDQLLDLSQNVWQSTTRFTSWIPNLSWNCRELNGITQTCVWKERQKRSARRRDRWNSICPTHVNDYSNINRMCDKSENWSYSFALIYTYLMSKCLIFPWRRSLFDKF